MSIVLKMLSGFVTKEVLLTIFKEVFAEAAIEVMEKFAKDSENPYDDMLVKHFKEYLEKTK
jgi:hypothetical protein